MLPIHIALLAGAFATPMNSLLSRFKPKVSSQPPSMTEPADSIMEDVEVADNTASLSVEIDNLAASCPEYALNLLKDYVMGRTDDTEKIFKNLDPQCVEAINGLCAKDIFKKQATQQIFRFYSGVQIQDIDQYESLKQLECDVGWYVFIDDRELEELIQAGIINPLRSVGLHVTTRKELLKITTKFPRLAELQISLIDRTPRSFEFQIEAKEVKVLKLTAWYGAVKITKSDSVLKFPELKEVSLQGFLVDDVKFPASLEKFHADSLASVTSIANSNVKELSFQIQSDFLTHRALESLPPGLEKLVISGGSSNLDTVMSDMSYLKSLVVLETSIPFLKVPNTLKNFVFVDELVDELNFQRILPTLLSSGATQLEIKTNWISHDALAYIPTSIKSLILSNAGEGVSILHGYASMDAISFTHVSAKVTDRDSLCSLAEIVKESKDLESLEFTISSKIGSQRYLPCETMLAQSIPVNLKNLKIILPENLHEIMLKDNFAFAQSIQDLAFKVMELDGINDHGFLKKVAPYLILVKRPTALL